MGNRKKVEKAELLPHLTLSELQGVESLCEVDLMFGMQNIIIRLILYIMEKHPSVFDVGSAKRLVRSI